MSAFINEKGTPAAVAEAAFQRRFRIVVSRPLMEEVDNVLARTRVRRRIKLDDELLGLVLIMLAHRARWVAPSGILHVSRDPRDGVIIETALEGRAKYVVSRDEDITRDLGLIEYLRSTGVEVLTVSQFRDLLDPPAE